VNLTVKRHRGLVNGYIVGLYPAGAMIAAPLFGGGSASSAVRATLEASPPCWPYTGAIQRVADRALGVTLRAEASTATPAEGERRRPVFWRRDRLLPGGVGRLMVLSQAARHHRGVWRRSVARRLRTTLTSPDDRRRRAWGRVDGRLADHPRGGGRRPRPLALAGNVALTLWPGPGVSSLALALVGLGYGVISVSPPRGCRLLEARTYGRVASRSTSRGAPPPSSCRSSRDVSRPDQSTAPRS